VCKSHYIVYLIQEIGTDNSLGKLTFTPTTLAKSGEGNPGQS